MTDEYAVPFRRAIAEAGLMTIMNSYTEIDGVPAAANRWLFTELLRDQLGIDGLVVSDYDSVNMLQHFYHTAATEGEVARQAVSAGLDVELPRNPYYYYYYYYYYSFLVEEVKSGRLDDEVVDTAVTRVLTLKARLGLIPGCSTPPPVPAPDRPRRPWCARRSPPVASFC